MTRTGKYPDTIYRVGTKAVIKNEEGKVLCVHDTGEEDMWSLPGGGLDHGDDVPGGLKRELGEELGYHGEVALEYNNSCVYYSHAIGAFVLYLVFDVELLDQYSPHAGIDAKEVAYLSLEDLAGYNDRQAEIIKKYGFGEAIDFPILRP
jgi:8-oxo-dGTP pyrophosphatase MutT (NUDIX family)